MTIKRIRLALGWDHGDGRCGLARRLAGLKGVAQMTQAYSDPSREEDPHALPDVEIFQLTAEEAAEQIDEDTAYEYRKLYPLAGFNSRDRQKMIDAIIEGEGIRGGWFYWFCFPGCLPDSEPMGPFDSEAEALAAARADQ